MSDRKDQYAEHDQYEDIHSGKNYGRGTLPRRQMGAASIKDTERPTD
jgi:hypothetical protein